MALPDKLTIYPGRPLRGTYVLPGDKSISHRAALLAAMAEGKSRLENFLMAGVTQVMLDALLQLGVTHQYEGADLMLMSPGMESWRHPMNPLDCAHSATTMRLLAGALAASGIPAELTGTIGLCSRPMDRIITPLQRMGVPIRGFDSNCAPLTLKHRAKNHPLHALDYTLPVASAQVKSCLLLAALAADGPTVIREPGPSRDHTERLLASLGIQVEQTQQGDEHLVRLVPPTTLRLEAFQRSMPGDISSAAFLIVAALITPGSEIILRKVGLNPTRTGLIDALHSMGGRIEVLHSTQAGGEPVGDLIVRHSTLHATHISGTMVVRMIDEFPAFAVAAAFAKGESVVSQARELRLKESDRIGMLVGELGKLGIRAVENEDGFVIRGEPPNGGEVDSHTDHRLAMALALAGLAGNGPVTIRGARIIGESFPEFPQALLGLGADLRVEGAE